MQQQVLRFHLATGNDPVGPEEADEDGVSQDGPRVSSVRNAAVQTLKAFVVEENLDDHRAPMPPR